MDPNRSTSSSTWLDTIDAAAEVAERVEQLDHVQPLPRVEPGERLVEHDDRGLVHDRLRHLDPLAHALRVGREPPGVAGVELDEGERLASGRGRVWRMPCSTAASCTNSNAVCTSNSVSCCGHEAELTRHAEVDARVAAEDAQVPAPVR